MKINIFFSDKHIAFLRAFMAQLVARQTEYLKAASSILAGSILIR